MKKEDKELLLKDLCARLPYGVIVEYGLKYEGKDFGEKKSKLTGRMIDSFFGSMQIGMSEVYSLQPYLRPMSSMTEEEKKDLLNYVVSKDSKYFEVCSDGSITDMSPDVQDFKSFELKWINFHPNTTSRYIGWLLKNHFDFCDLIPKGLALEAPEGMYKYK